MAYNIDKRTYQKDKRAKELIAHKLEVEEHTNKDTCVQQDPADQEEDIKNHNDTQAQDHKQDIPPCKEHNPE